MHTTFAEAKEFARQRLPLKRMHEISEACDRCGNCARLVALAVLQVRREAA